MGGGGVAGLRRAAPATDATTPARRNSIALPPVPTGSRPDRRSSRVASAQIGSGGRSLLSRYDTPLPIRVALWDPGQIR